MVNFGEKFSEAKNYLADNFMSGLPRFGFNNQNLRALVGAVYMLLLIALVVFVVRMGVQAFSKEKFEVLGQSQNHKFYTGARYDSERSDILTPREGFSYELPFVSVGAVDGQMRSSAELQALRNTFGETGAQRTTEAMLGSLAHGLA